MLILFDIANTKKWLVIVKTDSLASMDHDHEHHYDAQTCKYWGMLCCVTLIFWLISVPISIVNIRSLCFKMGGKNYAPSIDDEMTKTACLSCVHNNTFNDVSTPVTGNELLSPSAKLVKQYSLTNDNPKLVQQTVMNFHD